MSGIAKRNRFAEEIFSYRTTKDDRVLLFWYRKQVKILKGPAAQKFLEEIADANQQLFLRG